jgi:DNA-binding transcriptional regulator GbsR (MarR family)
MKSVVIHTPSPSLSPVRLELVEWIGRLCQRLGLPRSTGQIYGLLYLSPKPLSLDDIAGRLGISKASASTGTRQLVALHGLKQVWIQGDRRDHFEVEADLREVLRTNYREVLRPKLDRAAQRLEGLLEGLDRDQAEGLLEAEEAAFCRQRLEAVQALQKRFEDALPLAEHLL